MKSGNVNFLKTSGPLQACNGTALPFTSYDKMTRVLCEEDGRREHRPRLPGVTDVSWRQAGYITETQTEKSVIDCKICFQDGEKHERKVKKIMMKWPVAWLVSTVTDWLVAAVRCRPVVGSAVVRVYLNADCLQIEECVLYNADFRISVLAVGVIADRCEDVSLNGWQNLFWSDLFLVRDFL